MLHSKYKIHMQLNKNNQIANPETNTHFKRYLR